jgi:hypothetical protein
MGLLLALSLSFLDCNVEIYREIFLKVGAPLGELFDMNE